ncbi:hypothetical protein [Gilvibacter sp.]|uniref:hypothetical protein n=1 Tax=Gilvibacter sp. TaxID=2729997 RepID=UPI0025B8D712|nr:hypothetical protein [Gilvibacter sp.]NQX77022.1 hypothetical protein [Gilvibacter sp.]
MLFTLKRSKLRRLEISYQRWMRYAYTTAVFDKEESKRALQNAERKLQEIQGLLNSEYVSASA